ncbi:inorganic diphosphatase [Zunongwangia sp. HGR-M22]|uniref:inorganic diphosphatase n=1 Tax=Zunongwangia sp. HGR-M22 TaxID=3015168 RepID=UPI0022DDE1CB|nr:inorganic diphosphatase [Zunongwangia sp. HGR-M22]WBL26255.1 inorganic diphosphatase [Zunongwangia sp. HGR-M22]
MKHLKILILPILIVCFSCKNKDYYNLSARNEDGNYQTVVEIPAGTNLKIEYNHEQQKFLPDQREGIDRLIEFLPYPGNYGFIPSTFSDPEKGGDGDALDVLILGESLQSGTIVPIKPIAILKLLDENEEDDKIIAVPALKKDQIFKAETYKDFLENYPEAKDIIELWFLSYDKDNSIQLKGWGSEKEAEQRIEKWRE